jgi:hypothetical protein
MSSPLRKIARGERNAAAGTSDHFHAVDIHHALDHNLALCHD